MDLCEAAVRAFQSTVFSDYNHEDLLFIVQYLRHIHKSMWICVDY